MRTKSQLEKELLVYAIHADSESLKKVLDYREGLVELMKKVFFPKGE